MITKLNPLAFEDNSIQKEVLSEEVLLSLTKIEEVSAALEGKQDKINDLDAIRSGAAKGATAIQKVKTINGQSIEGEGDLVIKAGGSIDPELLEGFIPLSRDFSDDFNNDFAR